MENTSYNEDFCSTILQLFQFDSEEEKKCGNEAFVCCQCFLRSSCSEILFKKGVLQNFANLTEKHVCIKKRLQHRCFSVKFANFLRTSFFNRIPTLATSETKHVCASAVDLYILE